MLLRLSDEERLVLLAAVEAALANVSGSEPARDGGRGAIILEEAARRLRQI